MLKEKNIAWGRQTQTHQFKLNKRIIYLIMSWRVNTVHTHHIDRDNKEEIVYSVKKKVNVSSWDNELRVRVAFSEDLTV